MRRALRWRMLAVLAGTGVAVATALSPSWVTTAGSGNEQAGELTVTADPLPLRELDLAPGDEVHWTQDVSLRGAPSGRFSMRVAGSGSLVDHPRGLTMAVRSCTGSYDRRNGAPICTGVESRVFGTTALRDLRSEPTADRASRHWELDDLRAESPRAFAVTLAIPPVGSDDESLMNLTGSVGVGFYASGDGADSATSERADPSEGDLARTGGPSVWWWVAGVIVLGLGLVLLAGRRRRAS